MREKLVKIGAFAAVAGMALTGLVKDGVVEASCDLFGQGKFFIGCNYWAKHADMYMWRYWRPEVVEEEVAALAKNGVEVMRAGVDEEMMRRFRALCDIAAKNDIRLIVGLVTGWMSGRMFQPPALDERNPLTDLESVMWASKFVKHFVRTMKDQPAIAAWDYGNECNCMGKATTAEFYNWMNVIGLSIRSENPTRPIVSGLHTGARPRGRRSTRSATSWNSRTSFPHIRTAFFYGSFIEVLFFVFPLAVIWFIEFMCSCFSKRRMVFALSWFEPLIFVALPFVWQCAQHSMGKELCNLVELGILSFGWCACLVVRIYLGSRKEPPSKSFMGLVTQAFVLLAACLIGQYYPILTWD